MRNPMTKIKSERKQIIEEWQWIYANFPKFKLIEDMKNVLEINHSLGINAGHFKSTNYVDLYNQTFENEDYSICLMDYSLICMNYVFDASGKTISHNLMYIPCPTNEEENESLNEVLSKYIRVDYDRFGYKKTIHTLVHLHTNIYKSQMRIPIMHILTPKDFLFVILKYVYHSDDEIVNSLLVDKERDILLDSEDVIKFRLALGKNT